MTQQLLKSKNMTSAKEYGLLAMNVYVRLLKKYPGVKVEFRKKFVGKSGTSREIDVYAEIPVGPRIYKTAIECKNYKNKIGIEKVQEFLEKLQDINVDKGIMVTKAGYTNPAKKFAEEHRIDLIKLRKTTEDDREDRVKTIHTQMQIYYPEIYDVELKTDRKELVGKEMDGWADELVIIDENGNYYKNMSELIQENIKNDWTEEEKIANIIFEKSYFLKTDAEKIPVKGITFKYRFHKTPEEIVIDGEKIVEAIIKNTLTEKTRTVKFMS